MKPQDLNIVFMGTPEFAVCSLNALIEAQFNVVGVITSTDKPAGRGKKIKYSAVKEYALQKDLTILQPPNLKSPEFQEELRNLKADLFVVVAFRMLPDAVWQIPELGTINLHGSLLPQYRGAAPINWAVINGEETTGVTTFFIQKEIDTGNVIDRAEISISENMTAGELHDEMMEVGAECLVNTVHMIQQGKAKGIPQDEICEEALKPAPKIYRETCKIEWNDVSSAVHNKIRGLSPFPGAWGLLNDEKNTVFKFLKTELSDQEVTGEVGTIMTSNKDLFVKCDTGSVKVMELQMQGKKRMETKVFLNGFTFPEDSKFH